MTARTWSVIAGLVACGAALLASCTPAVSVLPPGQLSVPAPIKGNSGKYMCPFTQDDVMAEWTDKAVNAKLGGQIGKIGGGYAGRKLGDALGSQVPIFGGLVSNLVANAGQKAGEAIGRDAALASVGGWEFIRKTSDLSFNSASDMSVYLYCKCSRLDHYPDALNAAFVIYPDLAAVYDQALLNASRR